MHKMHRSQTQMTKDVSRRRLGSPLPSEHYTMKLLMSLLLTTEDIILVSILMSYSFSAPCLQ